MFKKTKTKRRVARTTGVVTGAAATGIGLALSLLGVSQASSSPRTSVEAGPGKPRPGVPCPQLDRALEIFAPHASARCTAS